jgi:hypothetical protein
MTNNNKAKNLTIASFIMGSLGFILFVYCKVGVKGKKCVVNMASKIIVALGVFLLAGAVYELSEKNEPDSD